LAKRALQPHPLSQPSAFTVGAVVSRVGSDVLKIDYAVVGPIGDLRLPAPIIPDRREGLWRHTCFEAFVGFADGKSYVEYNASPSREYAAFRFEGYRSGMQPALDLPACDVYPEVPSDSRFGLTLWLDLLPLAGAVPRSLGVSAILEQLDGRISYWAIAHPPGEPDFHHPDCFALELPAAPAP
jgi:hypothetical protein